jgi:hypothetical protein
MFGKKPAMAVAEVGKKKIVPKSSGFANKGFPAVNGASKKSDIVSKVTTPKKKKAKKAKKAFQKDHAQVSGNVAGMLSNRFQKSGQKPGYQANEGY